jgi:hypothetical protein
LIKNESPATLTTWIQIAVTFIDSKVKPYFDMILVIVGFVQQKDIDSNSQVSQYKAKFLSEEHESKTLT